jgi:hypothetical protein
MQLLSRLMFGLAGAVLMLLALGLIFFEGLRSRFLEPSGMSSSQSRSSMSPSS